MHAADGGKRDSMCESASSHQPATNQTIYKACREELHRRGIRKNQAMKVVLKEQGGCMVDTEKGAMLASKL